MAGHTIQIQKKSNEIPQQQAIPSCENTPEQTDWQPECSFLFRRFTLTIGLRPANFTELLPKHRLKKQNFGNLRGINSF